MASTWAINFFLVCIGLAAVFASLRAHSAALLKRHIAEVFSSKTETSEGKTRERVTVGKIV